MVPSRCPARLALGATIALLACDDPSGPSGIEALQLTLQPVAAGLTAPVFLTAPSGDSRLFVVERNGRIRIVATGVALPTPFLDIRDRVNFTGERGMLGMAFHPQYATNGFFYVYYVSLDGDVVVERFGSTPGADVAGASAGIVITIPHGGENHHGGMIAFGPDGMLYLAPGDGGCCGDPQNNAQNTGTLLGKLLRLDVSTTPYAIPPGNPFIGHVGKREEIWAYGLRSPWRFSFDAQEGMLYLADVGQDAREEINIVPAATAGINFGWRLMEGTACYNPSSGCNPGNALQLPAHEYVHPEGCSVTGGYVYRGSAIPELVGHYLYSDYCLGWLRSFRFSGGRATEHRSWAGIGLSQVVSFGRDGAGELYIVAGNAVWKIVRQ
jgi:glucose/arabinose dehydrogenase